MLRYFLYQFVIFVINTFPISFSYTFARFLSDCQYAFSPVDRRAVTINLKQILKDHSQLQHHVRDVFRNFGRYLVEFFWMKKHLTDQFIKDNIHINGLHYLDEALKQNKGVIIITGHMGNWELGAALFRRLGYPISAVALTHRHPKVDRVFNEQREAQGIKVIPIQIAVKKCFQTLHDKGGIAIVADRDFTQSGYEMDFFGKKVLAPKGPALLSLKTGAPIVPIFLVRQKNAMMKFDVVVYPPIFSEEVKGEPDEGQLKAVIAKYFVRIQEIIRQYPSQWLMFREF